jgi:hypothetical protein
MNKPRPGEKDRKTGVPLAHYRGIYKTLDPGEIARRCALPFYPGVSAFGLRIMGREYLAAFPDFALRDGSGAEVENAVEKILFLRYLCEGKYVPSGGKQLSYHEIPWGPVYYSNFLGRCINRFASRFGRNPAVFRRIMEETGELRAEPLTQGDAGYRFEFLNGLFMSLILWAGDEEFPPSAQILFDDNVVFAFTAEDLAALGEVVIDRLKDLEEKGRASSGPA